MPAAAVIPAPIAYIKVAAVKKLVVQRLARSAGLSTGHALSLALPHPDDTSLRLIAQGAVLTSTLRKVECFKQAHALNM